MGSAGPLRREKDGGTCCETCGKIDSDSHEDVSEQLEARPPFKIARFCDSISFHRVTPQEGTRLPDHPCSHDADCPRVTLDLLREAWWERVRLSGDSETEAACMVVPPKGVYFRRGSTSPEKPFPVILILTGKGHIDMREDFLWGGVDVLLRNSVVRERCIVVAPLPTTSSGLLHYEEANWNWTWNVDGVWHAFVAVLQRLGSSFADRCRLYATGVSLGASGVWHLALRYGQYLAAIAPVSGACQWPDSSWPYGFEIPDRKVLTQLNGLSVRAYQIDIDRRAGHPERDLRWLAWCFGLEEAPARQLVLPGMEASAAQVKAAVRSWRAKVGNATLELFQAEGPLHDWTCWGERGDNHCFWYRVYPFEEYEMIDWLLEHSVPVSQCWSDVDN